VHRNAIGGGTLTRLVSTKVSRLLLVLVFLYAAGFRLLTLDRPFQSDAESWGSFYGTLARNYLRFDWSKTHGLPVMNAGVRRDQPMIFYPDHSPVVSLLVAASYSAFGVGAWQTRVPSSLATIASLWVLYRLLNRFATRRAAVIGAALFAATPMTLYFGGLPEVLWMPLVLTVLLTVDGYLGFSAHPGRAEFARFAAMFALAALSDWPAFLIVPILAAHFLATEPRQQWPWMAGFCAVAAVVFVALYGYIALAADLPWDWMAALLAKHSAVAGRHLFTLREWVARAIDSNRARHTLVLPAAALAWLVTQVLPGRTSRPGETAGRILLGWGILHVALGPAGVFTDEWWWAPLTPGLVIATALLVDAGVDAIRARVSRFPAGFVAASAIAAFACWTTIGTWRELYPREGDPQFDADLGLAIQAAAPGPDDLAMVSTGETPDTQWWFYGDRPLRVRIWSIDDFEARRTATSADIIYDRQQPWTATATGIVVSRGWGDLFEPLVVYLRQHYSAVQTPPSVAARFEVFDLRRPLAWRPQ
jgi:4-amino-4-deoxy-L-arabinose transferase-like glycosyltransferase